VDTIQEPSIPVNDKNYDLITVLQVLLRSVWKIETYAKDADDGAGDHRQRAGQRRQP
jgi:hypothetical protein